MVIIIKEDVGKVIRHRRSASLARHYFYLYESILYIEERHIDRHWDIEKEGLGKKDTLTKTISLVGRNVKYHI